MERAFLFLLIALTVLEAIWIGYVLPGRLSGTMVLVAPMLMSIPFVASGTGRARFGAAMLTLPYFVHAVTEFAVGRSLLGLTISGVCLALYATLVLAGRRQRRD